LNFHIGRSYKPRRLAGSEKFGGTGNMSQTTLDSITIPEQAKKDLITWMNFSKSDSTWSAYRTVERMLKRCEIERGMRFKWPLGKEEVLIFIHWLITVRKLKSNTVNHYLAGLRNAHIRRGLEPPELRSVFVQQILKGRANMEAKLQVGGKKRRAVTVKVMKKIKTALCQASWGKRERLLIWAVSTIAFFGAFRIHELLCKHESTFDPEQALLWEDMTVTGPMGNRTLSVKLKCPKERQAGRPTVVDILEVGGPLCPIKAYKRWESREVHRRGEPMFHWPDGTPLTGRRFNVEVKRLLGSEATTAEGVISSHSFRSALPTILAEIGHSEDDLKRIGRWSSRAYNAYIKGPRTQRLAMAKKIAEMF